MRTAFVAMKFSSEPNKDKVYIQIKNTLRELGYDTIRADEIKTSGKIGDEVCNFLRTADLVVIDTTGNSHNVSYEIGFCHGIDRDTNTTILFRKKNAESIPFNYRHFRHKIYSSVISLDRELRDFLGASEKISGNNYCPIFTYQIRIADKNLKRISIDAIKFSISKMNYTGRCEIYCKSGFVKRKYIGDSITTAYTSQACEAKESEYFFWISACFPDKDFCNEIYFKEELSKLIEQYTNNQGIEFLYVHRLSELGSVKNIRNDFEAIFWADFKNGLIQREYIVN
jgi:uncharacterized protein (UPF0248 family)